MAKLLVRQESWPIRGSFRISRGAKTSAEVVVVELSDGAAVTLPRGRGECLPYGRYGETPDSVIAQIAALEPDLDSGLDRTSLQEALPPGAARNALDCALWDLEAKRAGKTVWELAGLPAPVPLVTAYTLSVDDPAAMAKAAAENADRPLLKIKLAGEGDLERVQAIREAAPKARLIVDANEGWSRENYCSLAPRFGDLGVDLIEQPFPAAQDSLLAELSRPVPVCADESCHDSASLPLLRERYDCINIKLDKAGGLTEALKLRSLAEKEGFSVMVGCMLATSLAMAPAILIAQGAAYVDLDGPLLLAQDRPEGLRYEGSLVYPPEPALWG